MLVVTLAAMTALAASACTSGGGAAPSASASSRGAIGAGASAGGSASRASPGPARSETGIAPTADLAAIRAAIDAINATAGGPVARQRAELDELVVPQQAAQQRACPAAQSTLAFQPAYSDLRLAPGATGDAASAAGGPSAGASGSPSGSTAEGTGSGAHPAPGTDTAGGDGTAYLLPAYITIYTGDRMTGTDLTTLHLWVTGGRARTAALCVS